MKKIVYIPLDERPCNATFVPKLFDGDPLRIVTPPALGSKKTPASWEAVRGFLLRECADADGLVLSMDMLLYGGLLPSRLHRLDASEAEQRLSLVAQLKARNEKLLIYAFQCIMRCPRYSSSDEEPDYYGECGAEIHQIGSLRHRVSLGLCGGAELDALNAKVPAEYLRDYTDRRAFNLQFNLRTLELLKDGTLDFLVIPQDDSAPYGFTAMDQHAVRRRMAELQLGARVLVYPGADEVGLTLTTRMALHFAAKRPRVYVKYASGSAPAVIPLYEDRPLGETVKYQLTAAGCRVATSLSEADLVLAVSCPGSDMREADEQPATHPGYAVERTLPEFVLFLLDCLDEGKPVTLCDNAYANGGDLELLALLDQCGLLPRLQGYAGWNTSSNTMGTAIAEGVHALLAGMTPQHRSFLALRYVEDMGYCSQVRGKVSREQLPPLGLTYQDVRDARGAVSALVRQELEAFVRERMPSIASHVDVADAWMPWRRMFEVGLQVTWRP
ncbi:MAG: DUF4127 family protein [Candidatus Spyradocola sp.]|nr:DUF4127 family protein [Candidatus Spyradocola sp.]